jgi:tetratricopeptide (TPR) repeat protein
MFAESPRIQGHRGCGGAGRRIRFGGAVAVMLLGIGAIPAAAQEKARDPAAAEQLYRAGRDLIAKGDWAAGCPKFAASMELDPVASTVLNIAKCYEHEGRLSRAWAEYKRALVVNQETPGTERRKALADIANKALAAIEPRLPRLRIVMSHVPDGLRISRDGQDLPLAMLGEAVPADPGEHEIMATAPGHNTDKRTVTLVEGRTAEVTLSLSPDALSPAPSPGPASPGDPAPASPPPKPIAASDGSGGIPVWAFITGGLGVALVGASIGFRVDMAAAEKTLDEKCGPQRVCDPNSGYDPASDNARKNRDFALFLALGGVGIAGIGVGVIGIVTAPPKKSAPAPQTAGITATPWVGPTGFGLSFHGVY